MNKLEIQSYLKRDKELFKKFDIEYVINNSSKITVNNIYITIIVIKRMK